MNFKRKRIKSNHHRDAMTKITSILIDLAGQEGCDGSPYDEMVIAAEYIEELENRIIELESSFNTMKKLTKGFDNLIKEIEEYKENIIEQKEIEEKLIMGCNKFKDPIYIPFDQLFCPVCKNGKLYPNMQTVSTVCDYCQQRCIGRRI